jgi:hypothetical protein
MKLIVCLDDRNGMSFAGHTVRFTVEGDTLTVREVE